MAAGKPSQRRQHFRSTLIPGGRAHPTEGTTCERHRCAAGHAECPAGGQMSPASGVGGWCVGGDEAAEMRRTLYV